MNIELCHCEICEDEINPEDAIYFYNDVQVNPNFVHPTNIYCKSCATENKLI